MRIAAHIAPNKWLDESQSHKVSGADQHESALATKKSLGWPRNDHPSGKGKRLVKPQAFHACLGRSCDADGSLSSSLLQTEKPSETSDAYVLDRPVERGRPAHRDCREPVCPATEEAEKPHFS
jgi:hypothetical protein